MIQTGLFSAGSSYFAFNWASNDGYDVMRSFFLTLGSAAGGVVTSIILTVGSCSSSSKKDYQLPLRNQFQQIKEKNFYSKKDFSNLDQQQCIWSVASKNPIYVSDYI